MHANVHSNVNFNGNSNVNTNNNINKTETNYQQYVGQIFDVDEDEIITIRRNMSKSTFYFVQL